MPNGWGGRGSSRAAAPHGASPMSDTTQTQAPAPTQIKV